MNKLKRILDDISDKSFVYSILLSRAERFNNHLKLGLKIPLIIVSAILGVINGNNSEDLQNIMVYVNPIFNIITTLILSFSSLLNLESKEQDFRSARISFIKLNSLIESKLVNTEENLTMEFINNIVNNYNLIDENINYEIPNFICRKTRDEFKEKKTLPLIINGIPKKDIFRSKSITMDDVSPLDSVLPINPNHSPRVLETKIVNTKDVLGYNMSI